MTLGVRIAAIDPRGRVMLVRHTYTDGFYFPGGGVERGETCETAAIRELEEEAGLILHQPPELLGVYANHNFFPNDHVLLYRATDWEERKPTSAGEIAEYGFYDALNPPEDTSPATRRRLTELFQNAAPSTIW